MKILPSIVSWISRENLGKMTNFRHLEDSLKKIHLEDLLRNYVRSKNDDKRR